MMIQQNKIQTQSGSFLQLESKCFLIVGVANKKSVATFCAKILEEQGAQLIFSVQSQAQKEKAQELFPRWPIYICDLEKDEEIAQLAQNLFVDQRPKLAGILHSLAFARFSVPPIPFHETSTADFLQACHISSFSLVTFCQALKEHLAVDASVVTVSISSTRATSYGVLGPIKAMLEATLPYLAKSFSSFSKVRFNAVGAGPLKTSASAGIPHYIENYLYAEQLTLRKQALRTAEVAQTLCFLLSPASSGINGQTLVVDCGMSCNYFDQEVVQAWNNAQKY